MGWDVLMTVIGECTLEHYIDTTKKKVIDNDNLEKYLHEIEEIAETVDRTTFFDSIHIIDCEGPHFLITSPDKFGITRDNFDTYLVLEVMSLCLGDDDTSKFEKFLEGISSDDFIFTINGLKIEIWSTSSYKGDEKLDINYSKIQDIIDYYLNEFPKLKVYTTLGLC